jgi:hypothetical protein
VNIKQAAIQDIAYAIGTDQCFSAEVETKEDETEKILGVAAVEVRDQKFQPENNLKNQDSTKCA